MRPKHNTLTPQELEIMKLVWQRGAATVRDVYEVLLERRKIAYTTVMTMMKILETKGYLKKRRQDRAFLYRPAHPHNQIIRGMINDTRTVDIALDALPPGTRAGLEVIATINIEKLDNALFVGRPVGGSPNTEMLLFKMINLARKQSGPT